MAITRNKFANAPLLGVEAEQLCNALGRPAATLGAALAAEFDRLAELVAALPLTTDEYCFAANWVASAQQLWEAGDVNACRYQLETVRRKLAR